MLIEEETFPHAPYPGSCQSPAEAHFGKHGLLNAPCDSSEPARFISGLSMRMYRNQHTASCAMITRTGGTAFTVYCGCWAGAILVNPQTYAEIPRGPAGMEGGSMAPPTPAQTHQTTENIADTHPYQYQSDRALKGMPAAKAEIRAKQCRLDHIQPPNGGN